MEKMINYISPLTSVQDKFLISAISVSGEDLAPQVINAQLKSSKPDAQYRFRCLLATDKVLFFIELISYSYDKVEGELGGRGGMRGLP